ncbi:4-aminobutyrate--pyruvate transaminase [Flagellimonas maritima]|uniref:4-aminobutyrate--pyruvate transaminase n=1 Tax=Flagellimonas maritima TaxID=1383885 RepID=A0A2Z4LUQ2_9FLAO|nr:aminotransferase [Allomuricauda aurantiaca]AWX45556.1 4-aminobutyrate--pyruvate transaminase [Allomuricauda aurantiaca]
MIFTKNNISSDLERAWQNDKDHVIHPYANYERFHEDGSVVYTKGDRHFIYDDKDRKYLDGIAGLWCVNIGHGNVEMAAHIGEQAKNLAYFNTFEDATSPSAANLAAKLASLCPGSLNHVFFGTGGSMANDSAIKIVHYYFNMLGMPKKKKILSRNLGYHGSTYLAHALTGISSTHIGFDLPKDMITYLSAPYPYRRPDEMTIQEFCDSLIEEMEHKILELGPETIACFIAEPIMGAGGVIVPPDGYLIKAYELCKKYNILVIADEVVTAFGRLGHLVASKEKFDVQPDIIVLAKGLSSGYIPLGATVISETIHKVISRPKPENPYFSHGFTYSGHALACATGLKNIEIMEREDFCGHVRTVGPYFKKQLKTLEDLPVVGEVRGSHFMLALEYVKDKRTKESFPAEINIGKRIYHSAKKRGLIIRPIGPINVLSPPLTYDKDAIDETVDIMKKSILETMNDLSKEGHL